MPGPSNSATDGAPVVSNGHAGSFNGSTASPTGSRSDAVNPPGTFISSGLLHPVTS